MWDQREYENKNDILKMIEGKGNLSTAGDGN
jgi:hypothetical protein